MDLLKQVAPTVVETKGVRKITINGIKYEMPVYKIDISMLRYNDKNARIFTEIEKVKREKGTSYFSDLENQPMDEIDEMIFRDREAENIGTQRSIEENGQQRPGVVLKDGRIIDGNRRFTCLRHIQKKTEKPQYFEAIILDLDANADAKIIKKLELTIQLGEEERVNYSNVNTALDFHNEVKVTKELTVDEIAQCANQSVKDVNTAIEVAEYIIDFLKYIGAEGQYRIITEMQLYEIFREMKDVIKNISGNKEKDTFKHLIYDNIILEGHADNREYVRNLKKCRKDSSDDYDEFVDVEAPIHGKIVANISTLPVGKLRTESDIKEFRENFAAEQEALAEAFNSMTFSVSSKRAKPTILKDIQKASQIIFEIDTKRFPELSVNDRNDAKINLEKMLKLIQDFQKQL